jgi:osmotically-inducible protein OsmY
MQRTDELIKKDVVEQLYWSGRVDASDLTVEVEDGIVTLEGKVPTFLTWEAALESARIVPGVTDVVDNVDIKYPDTHRVPADEELEEEARSRLVWNPDLDASDIEVSVDNGMLALQGSVEAYWKKIHAEEIVSRLSGVLSIENELTVVPTDDVLDKRIADEVIGALERNVLIDPEEINVRVEEGEVTLTGTVPSWRAEQAAYEAALYTTGVVEVRDNLSVQAA